VTDKSGAVTGTGISDTADVAAELAVAAGVGTVDEMVGACLSDATAETVATAGADAEDDGTVATAGVDPNAGLHAEVGVDGPAAVDLLRPSAPFGFAAEDAQVAGEDRTAGEDGSSAKLLRSRRGEARTNMVTKVGAG